MKRIGFACHYYVLNSGNNWQGHESFDKPFVMRATTRDYINKLPPVDALHYLHGCVLHNLNAIKYLVTRVGSLPEGQRMLRLSSEVLPLYTAPDPVPQEYYKLREIRIILAKRFAELGKLIRELDVKVSFHPDQWVVLGSDKDYVVENSLSYIEYHAYMIRSMGFAKKFTDVKCNIHLSGKAGVRQFIKSFNMLSPEARKVLTVENSEFGSGKLEDCLLLKNHLPIVLDIHHHLIASGGEYIKRKDERVNRVLDSWVKCDVRPTMHFSWIRESGCLGLDNTRLPKLSYLKSKHTDTLLRQHAMTFYNIAARDWALTFLDDFDIMCEAKAKNIASTELYLYAKDKGLIT